MFSKSEREMAIEIKRTRTRLASAEMWHTGRPGSVYLIQQHTNTNAYQCPFKIGQSINPSVRIEQLRRHYPHALSLVHEFPTNHMDLAEYRLHVAFERSRIRDEWFRLHRETLQWLVNIGEFTNGEFISYKNQITLPRGFWDGVIDLPF